MECWPRIRAQAAVDRVRILAPRIVIQDLDLASVRSPARNDRVRVNVPEAVRNVPDRARNVPIRNDPHRAANDRDLVRNVRGPVIVASVLVLGVEAVPARVIAVVRDPVIVSVLVRGIVVIVVAIARSLIAARTKEDVVRVRALAAESARVPVATVVNRRTRPVALRRSVVVPRISD